MIPTHGRFALDWLIVIGKVLTMDTTQDRWDEPTRNDPIARDPASLDAVALGADEVLIHALTFAQSLGLTPTAEAEEQEPETSECDTCHGRGGGEEQLYGRWIEVDCPDCGGAGRVTL